MASKQQVNEIRDDLVKIGEVVKPHGIRGEVKVLPYSGRPENFRNYKRIFLRPRKESHASIYQILKSRIQGKLAILALAGITSREAAAELQGNMVCLLKEDFQRPGPNEYYWHQLEDFRVITESGRELGQVSRMIHTAAHDIMIVTGLGHEYMIPFKADIVCKVDQQKGEVIISPPEGLLDINIQGYDAN